MDTIFMNSIYSKTSDPHRLLHKVRLSPSKRMVLFASLKTL